MVDVFMAHTSGFFWNQFIALFLGVFLASRLRGMTQALVAAVPAGVLLAAVNFAVAWQSSTDARRRLAWWAENSPVFSADLLADDRFQQVLAAGLAAFPIAAIAGVGLGILIAPSLRALNIIVTFSTALSTVFYGVPVAILGWVVATADDEPCRTLRRARVGAASGGHTLCSPHRPSRPWRRLHHHDGDEQCDLGGALDYRRLARPTAPNAIGSLTGNGAPLGPELTKVRQRPRLHSTKYRYEAAAAAVCAINGGPGI
jgi:hypothetical protein